MKRLVIVGATGMVGGCVLRSALEHPNVERVTSVGRRKLSITHPKLTEVLHSDFSDCSSLADALLHHDAAIFCLGTYTGTVPEQELCKITVDYTIEFARVFRTSSPSAVFAFLSGRGADPTGRSRMAFARSKGAAEAALVAMHFLQVYILRPAYIYPVQPRTEPSFSYRLLRALFPALRRVFPKLAIRSDDLARVMVNLTVSAPVQGTRITLENEDLVALAMSTNGENGPPWR
jgi:uncharacterized protein YbjT (DUF2867 family)